MGNTQNLITLFRAYHKLGIPNYVGASANAIFHGLLYKFNEMGFPSTLKISNREMLTLSGIADIRTFRNARNILATYLHNEDDPESYLINFTNNDIKEYSVYRLNYVILQEDYSKVTGILQEDYSRVPVKMSLPDEDRVKKATDLSNEPTKYVSLSDTIQDNTRQYNTSFPSESFSISTKKEIDDIDDDAEKKENEKFEKIKKAIIRICPNFKFANIEMGNKIREFCSYPEEQINLVIEKAGISGQKPERILGYIQRGLDNFEKWYADYGGGNGGTGKTDKVKEELDAKYNSEEYWQERSQYEEEAKARNARLIKEAEERQERRIQNANKRTDTAG